MPRLFITMILIGCAALLGVFYLRPEWQRFQTLRREIAELEEIGVEFAALIANRDALLARINAISKENLGRADRMLPQGPRTADFLVSIEALTMQSGMALRRIDVVSPQEEKTDASARPGGATSGQPRPAAGATAPRTVQETKALPFSIQIAGSYEVLKKFLTGLERNLRLIDVENISFSAGEKGDIADVSIKAKTYYQ